jgi:hypothetical protein
MRLPIVAAMCLVLFGCGAPSSLIKSETLAFDDIIEDTTNKLLLLNVLRARDKAPLHFADIPSIRESIQQTASFSSLNFIGPRLPTAVKDSLTLGGNIQSSPSFEVTHLQSKDFNTGIASPIDPKFVKYWLDRGLDRRIVLLMFFSSAELVETRTERGPKTAIRITNSPREAIDLVRARAEPVASDPSRCDVQSDFERYLRLINNLTTFFAHTYKERRLIASGLKFDLSRDSKVLQDFATMDPSKAQLIFDRGTSAYNLYAISNEPKTAFCFFEGDRPAGSAQPEAMSMGTAAANRNNCFQNIVDIAPEDSTRPQLNETPAFFPGVTRVPRPSLYCGIFNRFMGVEPSDKKGEYPKLELRLHLRSVGEIFQFLGDLLYYQEELHRLNEMGIAPETLNTPVTFGYCKLKQEPGCDDVFLRLDDDACNARFGLVYRDRPYFVANHDAAPASLQNCQPGFVARRDHTLEILSVLHQLVGLNKSAADIRATPFVQVVQ